MKTFSQEIRKQMSEAFNGSCQNCLEKAHDCHHKLPNIKINQNKFPLFLQSPMNLQPLCRTCHDRYNFHSITEKEAAVYEQWLKNIIEKYLDRYG